MPGMLRCLPLTEPPGMLACFAPEQRVQRGGACRVCIGGALARRRAAGTMQCQWGGLGAPSPGRVARPGVPQHCCPCPRAARSARASTASRHAGPGGASPRPTAEEQRGGGHGGGPVAATTSRESAGRKNPRGQRVPAQSVHHDTPAVRVPCRAGAADRRAGTPDGAPPGTAARGLRAWAGPRGQAPDRRGVPRCPRRVPGHKRAAPARCGKTWHMPPGAPPGTPGPEGSGNPGGWHSPFAPSHRGPRQPEACGLWGQQSPGQPPTGRPQNVPG
jgi:hypothetical protein